MAQNAKNGRNKDSLISEKALQYFDIFENKSEKYVLMHTLSFFSLWCQNIIGPLKVDKRKLAPLCTIQVLTRAEEPG